LKTSLRKTTNPMRQKRFNFKATNIPDLLEKGYNAFAKIGMTDLDKLKAAIKENVVCKPMNDLKESSHGTNGGVAMWLNPHNQKCFNFGYFGYPDFYDWLEGKGNIVKGDTDEEKRKYYDVAVFEATHDYGWGIGYNKKFFSLLDETYYPKSKQFSFDRQVEKPLKIGKANHGDIIGKVFGSICGYYSDMEMKYNSNATQRMQNELQGAKETLYALGCGYYGANNLPEDVENLNWCADLCVYKTLYLYLLKNDYVLPDFDFVYADRNKEK
jgi:hypothetical protein